MTLTKHLALSSHRSPQASSRSKDPLMQYRPWWPNKHTGISPSCLSVKGPSMEQLSKIHMCISVDLLLAWGVSFTATQGNTYDAAWKRDIKAVRVFVHVQREDSLVILVVRQAPGKTRNLIRASSGQWLLFQSHNKSFSQIYVILTSWHTTACGLALRNKFTKIEWQPKCKKQQDQ